MDLVLIQIAQYASQQHAGSSELLLISDAIEQRRLAQNLHEAQRRVGGVP
jgi:hypothetical protein